MSIRAASPSCGYAFQSPWRKSRCRATASGVLVSLRDVDSQAGLLDLHWAVRLVVKMGQLWQEQELAVLCASLRISHRSSPTWWPGEPPCWVRHGYGPPALVNQAYRLERSYQAS